MVFDQSGVFMMVLHRFCCYAFTCHQIVSLGQNNYEYLTPRFSHDFSNIFDQLLWFCGFFYCDSLTALILRLKPKFQPESQFGLEALKSVISCNTSLTSFFLWTITAFYDYIEIIML